MKNPNSFFRSARVEFEGQYAPDDRAARKRAANRSGDTAERRGPTPQAPRRGKHSHFNQKARALKQELDHKTLSERRAALRREQEEEASTRSSRSLIDLGILGIPVAIWGLLVFHQGGMEADGLYQQDIFLAAVIALSFLVALCGMLAWAFLVPLRHAIDYQRSLRRPYILDQPQVPLGKAYAMGLVGGVLILATFWGAGSFAAQFSPTAVALLENPLTQEYIDRLGSGLALVQPTLDGGIMAGLAVMVFVLVGGSWSYVEYAYRYFRYFRTPDSPYPPSRGEYFVWLRRVLFGVFPVLFRKPVVPPVAIYRHQLAGLALKDRFDFIYRELGISHTEAGYDLYLELYHLFQANPRSVKQFYPDPREAWLFQESVNVIDYLGLTLPPSPQPYGEAEQKAWAAAERSDMAH